jgi:hypothetical protein
MLGRKHYDKQYIDACRARIAAQVAAYDDLKAAARDGAPVDAFEPLFFNNMVLVLDNLFCHRLRGVEGKDGNPLNEVRVLCTSLMENGGVLVADKTIKLKPEESILGYAVGDEIRIDEDGFVRLSEGFFAEIEKRFA